MEETRRKQAMERNILDTEIALAKDMRQEKVGALDGLREVRVVGDPERLEGVTL